MCVQRSEDSQKYIRIIAIKMSSEGLKRRRPQVNQDDAASSASNGGKGDSQPNDVDGLNGDGGESNEGDDGGSKETRLTLMEEVLLLGLKDKEVCVCIE